MDQQPWQDMLRVIERRVQAAAAECRVLKARVKYTEAEQAAKNAAGEIADLIEGRM